MAAAQQLMAGAVDFTEGSMVALFPDPEVAAALALPDGQPADSLHVTLAFLPEGVAEPETVAARLFEMAQLFYGLDGEVGGFGIFQGGDDGVPVIALPDVPGLDTLRVAVVAVLEDAGVVVADNHGFVPHMTLGYGAGVVPDMASLGLPLQFATVSLVAGPERWDLPFGAVTAAAGDEYTAVPPEVRSWWVQWKRPRTPQDMSGDIQQQGFATEAEAKAFAAKVPGSNHQVYPRPEPPPAPLESARDIGRPHPAPAVVHRQPTGDSWVVQYNQPEFTTDKSQATTQRSFATRAEAEAFVPPDGSTDHSVFHSNEPPFSPYEINTDSPDAYNALVDKLDAQPERYPPEQGGHPKGWGLGPAYKMKDDQVVGRPGGVPQVGRPWDPSKHPHVPAGSSKGGQWATKVGVTPFRPGDDPQGFYDSAKFKAFEGSIDEAAARYDVTVDAKDRVQGFWQGEQEPSVALDVHDGEEGVRMFSEDIREKWDQDAVVLFQPDRAGPNLAYRAEVPAGSDVAAALTSAGVDGATIYDNGFEVFGDEGDAAKVLAAADKLGVPHSAVKVRAGKLSFVERKVH